MRCSPLTLLIACLLRAMLTGARQKYFRPHRSLCLSPQFLLKLRIDVISVTHILDAHLL